MGYYIAETPDGALHTFDDWHTCARFRDDHPGTRVQSVATLEVAEQIVAGGVILPDGQHAFTDGNALGGVGIVFLRSEDGEAHDVVEIATNVFDVFAKRTIPALSSPEKVAAALASIRQILAELAGLYGALSDAPASMALTVVHDYLGVGQWMTGGWKTKDVYTSAVIEACRAVATERGLTPEYRHQRGHQKTWVGRDDYARWNARADQLATAGAKAQPTT